jgi:MFS family permease
MLFKTKTTEQRLEFTLRSTRKSALLGPFSFLKQSIDKNRLRGVIFAYSLSQLSEGLTQTAITWIAYKMAVEKLTLISKISFLQTLIPFLIILPIGFVIDKLPKPPLLSGINIFKGATYAILPLIALFNQTSSIQLLTIVTATAFLSSFFGPAFNALLPSFVPIDRLQRANGYIQLFGQGGYFLGPLLFAFLLLHMNAPQTLLVSGIGYVLSASLFILIPQTITPSTVFEDQLTKNTSPQTKRKAGSSLFHILRSHPSLLLPMLLGAVFGLINAPMSLLFPALTTEVFQQGKSLFSLLSGSYFAGSLTAGWILVRFQKWNPKKTIAGGIFISSISLFLLSASRTSMEAIVLLWAAGTGLGLILPLSTSLIQKESPQSTLGRALSLSGFFFLIAAMGGIYLGTRILSNKGTVFYLSGAAAILLIIAIIIVLPIGTKKDKSL